MLFKEVPLIPLYPLLSIPQQSIPHLNLRQHQTVLPLLFVQEFQRQEYLCVGFEGCFVYLFLGFQCSEVFRGDLF